MDTMQGNKATMQLKRISGIVMIPIAKQVIHAALGRKQAMPNSRLTPLPSSALTCTPTELPLSRDTSGDGNHSLGKRQSDKSPDCATISADP